MKKKRRVKNHKKPSGLPIREANEKISNLKQGLIPFESGSENLDLDLDPEIVVKLGDISNNITHPYYTMKLIVDEVTVAWLSVVDFEQQIGSQSVRMGGIAGVGTHNDYRFKGYGKQLMRNLLRWLRHEGFDTTLLYGVLNYYPRFGYAPAFPATHFSMALRDAKEAIPSVFSFADFQPKYLRDVLRIYHKSNAKRTGPNRRNAKYWKGFQHGYFKGPPKTCKVILDSKKHPVGYITYDVSGGHHAFELQMSMTLMEIGYTTPAVFPDVLEHLAKIASKNDLENFGMILPEDLEFIDFCKLFGLRKSIFYRKDGGGLVRMINIPSTLKKVSGVLGSRMVGSSGEVNLGTNLDNVGLRWSKGQLKISAPRKGASWVRMPQWALAQLLYGSRNPKTLADQKIIKASRSALLNIEQMFPEKPHYHYEVDHF